MNLFNSKSPQNKNISGELKKFQDVTEKYEASSQVAIHTNRIKEDKKIISKVDDEITCKLKLIKHDEIKKYKIHTELLEQVSILINKVNLTKEEYFSILNSIKALEESIEFNVKEIERLSGEKIYLEHEIKEKTVNKQSLEAEADTLNNKLNVIRENYGQISSEYNLNSNKTNEIAALVERRKNELKRLEYDLNDKENKLDLIKQKKELVENNFFEINKRYKEVERNLINKKNELIHGEKLIVELLNKKNNLEANTATVVEEYKKYYSLVQNQETKINEIKSKISEAIELQRASKEKLENHQKVLNSLQGTENATRLKLSEVELENQNITRKYQSLKYQIDNLKSQINTKTAEIQKLNVENTLLENQNLEFNSEVKKLENVLVSMNSLLESKNNENKHLLTEVANLKTTKNTKESEMNLLKRSISDAEIELLKNQSEYKLLSDKIISLNLDEENNKKKLVSIIEELQNLELEIQSMSNNKSNLEANLQSTLNQVNSKSSHLEDLKQKSKNDFKEYNELIGFYQTNKKELVQVENECELLVQTISDLEIKKNEILSKQKVVYEKIKKHREELKFYNIQKDELNNNLDDKRVTLHGLEVEFADIRSTLNSKRETVEELKKALSNQTNLIEDKLKQIEINKTLFEQEKTDTDNIQNEILNKRTENEKLAFEYKSLLQDINKTKELNKTLEFSLNKETIRGKEIFDQLELFKTEFNNLNHQYINRKLSLEKEIESSKLLEDAHARLNQENEVTKDKIADINEQFIKIQKKNQSLEKNIHRIKKESEVLARDAEKAEALLIAEAKKFSKLKTIFNKNLKEFNTARDSVSSVVDLGLAGSRYNLSVDEKFETFLLVNSISKNTVLNILNFTNHTESEILKNLVVSLNDQFNAEEVINSEAQIHFSDENNVIKAVLSFNGLKSNWEDILARLHKVKESIVAHYKIELKTNIRKTTSDTGIVEGLVVTWSFQGVTQRSSKSLKTKGFEV
jgi:chromosome segregation ATPase